MLDVILLIIFAVIPAIVLHEVAHGFCAYKLGDPTARDRGRLTLNPISHMDLVGSVLIPGGLFLAHYFGLTRSLILFGWAKPVPVNFRNLRPARLGMILVAIAGPLTNIVLAWIFSRLYIWPVLSKVSNICAWAVMLNLTLAVFNMIPLPPLDGSRVITGFLPPRLAYEYNRLEPFGFIILIVIMQLGLLRFLYPVIEQVGFWIGVQL